MVKFTAKEQLWRKINKRFVKGVVRYGLLEDGDKILVGLSGGKDSLALLELLAAQMRVYKPKISVVAVHVSMKNIPYQVDLNYLESFSKQLQISFLHRETSFNPDTDTRKSPCFLCSWNRRKTLFEIAKELGCNKIALGHHMDDILQTLLMNMTFQGTFSSMPPKMRMKKFDMTMIRPMCLVHETDLKEWSIVQKYKNQVKNCPYEIDSHRADMKKILEQLEEMNTEARFSLWSSMNNIQKEFLPEEK
jgi:tRNA(Ile)-lysidine synthase TilS/MesJ